MIRQDVADNAVAALTCTPQLAIVADDATGAADAGAAYARAGLVTLLALTLDQPPSCDVVIFSTESRHLGPAAARARVASVAGHIRDACWVFKKIDSTLRGQPGHELAALMDVLAVDRGAAADANWDLAIVAPAFPAQGRTVMGGRVFVDRTPLDQTVFALEGASADIVALLRASGSRPVTLVALETVRRGAGALSAALPPGGMAVIDGETDADLAVVAQVVAARRIRLACGSAGLAEAMAQALPLQRRAVPPSPPRRSGPALVVAGSRNPRTLRQVDSAERWGVPVVRPDNRFLAGDVSAIVDAVSAVLGRGRPAALTTAGLADCADGSLALAGLLGRATADVAARVPLGGLILTGGDIAAAALAALGAQAIWLQGEMEAGIARGALLGGLAPGLPVITKAGGFGDDEALVEAIATLARPAVMT